MRFVKCLVAERLTGALVQMFLVLQYRELASIMQVLKLFLKLGKLLWTYYGSRVPGCLE